MVTGTRLPVSAARAQRWLAMMAFAVIGAVSEDGVSAALVGAAVGAIPASVGDSVLAGDGASAGVLSGIGRLIGGVRGGMDIMAGRMHTLIRSCTRMIFGRGRRTAQALKHSRNYRL